MAETNVRNQIIIILGLTYAVALATIAGIYHWGNMNTLVVDGEGVWLDIRNWVAMVVTLIIPVGIAVVIWRYSYIKQKPVTEMIGKIDTYTNRLDTSGKKRKEISYQAIQTHVVSVNTHAKFLVDDLNKLKITKKGKNAIEERIGARKQMMLAQISTIQNFLNASFDVHDWELSEDLIWLAKLPKFNPDKYPDKIERELAETKWIIDTTSKILKKHFPDEWALFNREETGKKTPL